MKSAYKQAVRNWLFCAILSVIKEDIKKDDSGNILSYTTYVLKLNDGLFKTRKTYIGKTKVLKNAKKIEDTPVTKNPKEFVEFLFSEGIKPEDVATFEDAYRYIIQHNYKFYNILEDIEDEFLKFLKRANLKIPKEIYDRRNIPNT